MLDMKRVMTLRTVEDVVAAFGGTAEMADWAGLGMSAISNWMARGFIPPGWHYRISAELKERGLDVAPQVFGERDDRGAASRGSSQAVA